MEWDGWIEMRCDAMRCDGGWAAGQTGEPVRMPTELKPALWGTSSLSHPLTGSLQPGRAGQDRCLEFPLATVGPCQPGAPEAVPHGSDLSCSRCEPHVFDAKVDSRILDLKWERCTWWNDSSILPTP